MVTAWVMDRIHDVAGELDGISPFLSTRVFEDFAPAGYSVYPFLIVQCQQPPRDIRGVGVARVMVDTLFVVKAVAQVLSYGPLAPIAKVLDSALTVEVADPVGDGAVITSVRNEQFSMVEVDNGKQYRHFGGVYKIQAQG